MYLAKNILILITGTLSFSPMAALADDAARNKEIVDRFKKCDKNHDGKLTKDEAKGCMPRIYDHFSYIDSNSKGYVTVAEIEAAASR
jgi:Ca2+-binding EF-hand superfamily protein